MEAGTDEVSTGGLFGVAGIIGEAGVGKGDTIGGGEMGGGEMGGGEIGGRELGVSIVGAFNGELGIVGVPDEGGGDPEDGCPGRETGGELGVGIIGGLDGELGILGVPDEGGGDPEDGCPGRETGGRGIGDCVGDLGKSFSNQVPGIKAIGRIQVAVR